MKFKGMEMNFLIVLVIFIVVAIIVVALTMQSAGVQPSVNNLANNPMTG
jgi:hypothetical protein